MTASDKAFVTDSLELFKLKHTLKLKPDKRVAEVSWRVQQLKDIIALAGDQQEIYIFMVDAAIHRDDLWYGIHTILHQLSRDDDRQLAILLNCDEHPDSPFATTLTFGKHVDSPFATTLAFGKHVDPKATRVRIALFSAGWFEASCGLENIFTECIGVRLDGVQDFAPDRPLSEILGAPIVDITGEYRYGTLAYIPRPKRGNPTDYPILPTTYK